MKWSLKLARIFGVDVYLHFTFLLLLGFLGLVAWQSTGGVEASLEIVVFVLALFACVLLHEFGHALMARRFGIATSDITLLPIGGIARLERMPERPAHELMVAVAGPAVNLIIAAILAVWLVATSGFSSVGQMDMSGGPFLRRLMVFNLALVAFNLLPAFPMDGGRVLRALLAARLGRRRATAIAAQVGQALAIAMGFVGFFYSPVLIFIAIFVFLGAQAESGLVEVQAALKGLRVRDAMMTRFRRLGPDDTLEHAVDELLAGSQQDFPVMAGESVLGVLRRNDLVKALGERRLGTPVREIMCRECTSVEASAPLRSTMESMQTLQCAALPVADGARTVGLLSLENISEMIMIHAALERSTITTDFDHQPHTYARGSHRPQDTAPQSPLPIP